MTLTFDLLTAQVVHLQYMTEASLKTMGGYLLHIRYDTCLNSNHLVIRPQRLNVSSSNSILHFSRRKFVHAKVQIANPKHITTSTAQSQKRSNGHCPLSVNPLTRLPTHRQQASQQDTIYWLHDVLILVGVTTYCTHLARHLRYFLTTTAIYC